MIYGMVDTSDFTGILTDTTGFKLSVETKNVVNLKHLTYLEYGDANFELMFVHFYKLSLLKQFYSIRANTCISCLDFSYYCFFHLSSVLKSLHDIIS